jgi:hypothetical protein
MTLSKPIIYGIVAGCMLYNTRNNSKILYGWLYLSIPYTIRYIYDKQIIKYKIMQNSKITSLFETGMIGISLYSLYKSSNIFNEITKTIQPNTFINYISLNIIKYLAGIQYNKFIFLICGSGITYIFSKYLQYCCNKYNNLQNKIIQNIDEFMGKISEIALMINNFIIAINDNVNYDIHINNISLRGIACNKISTISEEELEKIIPLCYPNKDNLNDVKFIECSICLETLDKKMLHRILPCKHAFHAHCIDKWLLLRSQTCPLCRITILK